MSRKPTARGRTAAVLIGLLLGQGALPEPARAADTGVGAADGAEIHRSLAPFTAHDLLGLRRVSEPQASPDGRFVAFTVRDTDLDAGKTHASLWIIDLDATAPRPRPLATDPANDSSPRWAPDSRTLYFLSNHSGSSQVWRLALDGKRAERVTDYPLEVGSFKVSPSGERLALTLRVFADCATLACTRQRLDARDRDPASGRVYDHLFVRHWTEWSDGTRSHLFSAHLGRDGTADLPVDVSGSLDADVPSRPFGGSEEYAFSPDGRQLVWSARLAGRSEPWSTNFDLYRAAADGSTAPENLTAGNPAWDAQPVFLRNGDLAYLAQERPGFESDRFHIVIRNAHSGATRALAMSWDRSVSTLAATPDGRRLIVSADDLGQHALFALDLASGRTDRLQAEGQVTEFTIARDTVVMAYASLGAPAELRSIPTGGGATHALTEFNAERLAGRASSPYEQFSFAGANADTVYGYVMKPYGYVEGRKYPIAFVVHGGPQSSFGNAWSYRWNSQVLAGAGYAVVFIDFHGSTGYGQKFTDSVSGDWGGKPLVDLQKGLAAAVARYPWLDGERACSLGASYGGFMQNWILGHWPDRFRCIVDHSGVFDQRMMYYSTEELWFSEWEFGAPYFENPANYEKFNPVNDVGQWRTPTLVIHGALDYRVPLTQGLGTFTALQRRGIESRFLYFPDEGHWVVKPANSELWYATVLGWLDEHLKP
jgi:dipeptidyl aminopeptidase/acylaminoacyl peptidase